MVITSTSNERIKNVSKLLIKKYRDEAKLFLVEGDHLVGEAYKNNLLVEVYALEDTLVKFDDIVVNYVTKDVMKKISDQVTSTNIIGVCKYNEYTINDVLNDNLILLDSLQDPGNLGTIIRSASAFNYSIVLGENTVDIYNSKTIRSTEGGIFNVKFIKSNLVDFINNNKNYNYLIADMHKGYSVKEYSNSGLVAIIMGNEGNGVSNEIRSLDLDYIHINQTNKCESLNVGVAASIIMHELGDINE